MARECSFILPSGRRCRCAATRNQALCRHHAPKPARPGPPPIPKNQRYSNLARWRQLGANLQWMPADEIPLEIYNILQCLIDRGTGSHGRISDLTAGRFLRALLNRLGDVPFPDPDTMPIPAAAAAPAAHAAPNPAELDAMIAQLIGTGTASSPALPHPSGTRMNQSHLRGHQ